MFLCPSYCFLCNSGEQLYLAMLGKSQNWRLLARRGRWVRTPAGLEYLSCMPWGKLFFTLAAKKSGGHGQVF